ncbi:MAG: hypothetical protein ACREHG_02560, partial [Candidatus Saccharimonadales bacterium]
MNLFLVATICFVILLAALALFLKDFSRFLYKTTVGVKLPQGFVGFGQYAVTGTTILSITLAGALFYRMGVAFIAYCLSGDLTSMFTLLRGVFTTKVDIQNPFSISSILSGLILEPALQFLTVYFMSGSIHSFMDKMDGNELTFFYETDAIYFSLISTMAFILINILFLTQSIGGPTGITHIIFLSLSSIAPIIYLLGIIHIQFLRHNSDYRERL